MQNTCYFPRSIHWNQTKVSIEIEQKVWRFVALALIDNVIGFTFHLLTSYATSLTKDKHRDFTTEPRFESKKILKRDFKAIFKNSFSSKVKY